MIIIVFGLPGSGKSYFAERLADRLQAKRLSTDLLRKKRFSDPVYSEQEKMQVYGALIQGLYLHAGTTLVLDGTFYKAKIRDTFTWTADKLGEKIRFIEVKADEKTIKKRISNKRSDSDADFNVYLQIRKEFEPMNESHLILQSTDNNISEMLDEAIHYLDNHKIIRFESGANR